MVTNHVDLARPEARVSVSSFISQRGELTSHRESEQAFGLSATVVAANGLSIEIPACSDRAANQLLS